MRFLIEKSVLSDDQELNFQSMSRENKVKFIDKYLKSHPNINNLQYALDVCKQSILEKGFDDSENIFLRYMNTIKYPLKRDVANLVKYFLEKDDLDVSARWLYKKDLYEGSEEDTIFKIKAMVYASNNDLQQNASKKISPQDLLNKNGKIMEVVKIKKILRDITVTKKSKSTNKVQDDAIEALVGLGVNKSKAIKLSKEFFNDPNMSVDELVQSILKVLNKV